MKTYLAKNGEIDRKAILIDADGVVVGRLAVVVANALRGKDRPTYTPHTDTGAMVIVINAEKSVFTGKKNTDKVYVDFSGYRGGLKEQTADVVREKNPIRIIKDAVWGMMPHNRLGREQFKKIRVYAGPNHEQIAQQPEIVTV